MYSPRLSIVIVNWNTYELLEICLKSLFKEKAKYSFKVIVIDNASSDGSPQKIESNFPDIKLIMNDQNVGFAKANNAGIRNSSSDYILLLNSDTEIPEAEILEKWIDFMDLHEEAGASGCKLIFPDGSHQVGDAGFRPGVFTAFNHAFFLSKAVPRFCKGLFVSSQSMNKEIEVDWISGADLMLRRSMLEKAGLLDESIFMFAEDVEFGCRMKDKGYKVFYLPYLKIMHLQGGSSKKGPENISCIWLQNLRYVYYADKKRLLTIFDLLLMTGMYLRAFSYYFMYLFKREIRYLDKSRRTAAYGSYMANVLGRVPIKAEIK